MVIPAGGVRSHRYLRHVRRHYRDRGFCLLGIELRKQTAAQLLQATSLWTLAGLIVTISAGRVIMTTDPVAYYLNWSFRHKIIALVVATVFNYTIHRKVVMSDTSSQATRTLVALVSLTLWISIVFSGLFYAFTSRAGSTANEALDRAPVMPSKAKTAAYLSLFL